MSNPSLFKTKTAGGAIAPFRIVAHGAADGQVVQAAAANATLCGTTGQIGASAAGDRVDVAKAGLPEVELGGIVARGAPLTADANGKAIAAAPAAGTNARIIGFAEVSGIAGDRIPYLFAPGMIQG